MRRVQYEDRRKEPLPLDEMCDAANVWWGWMSTARTDRPGLASPVQRTIPETAKRRFLHHFPIFVSPFKFVWCVLCSLMGRDGQLLTVEERKIGLQGFSDHWLESGMQLDHSKYAEKVS